MTDDYTIVYSNRRTVGIDVNRDGAVVVRAPKGMNEEDLHRLVLSKKRWIDEKVGHPQKYGKRDHPPGKELVSGESMLYLGRNYRVEVIDTSTDGIEFDQRFLVPRRMSSQGRSAFRQWYLEAAHKELVPRAADWASRLGVVPGRVRITDVQYRWGSCTAAGNVSLNWRLIKAPIAVCDYVIVHELAHLLESSHGDRFWSIVRSQIPKVEGSRTWLRENGHLLEQDL